MLIKREYLNKTQSSNCVILRNLESEENFGHPWIAIAKMICESYGLDDVRLDYYRSQDPLKVEEDGFNCNICYLKFNNKCVLIDNSDGYKIRGIDNNQEVVKNLVHIVIKRNFNKSLINYYNMFDGKVFPFFSYPTKYFYEHIDNLDITTKKFKVVGIYGNSNVRTKIIDNFIGAYKDSSYFLQCNCTYPSNMYYELFSMGHISLCMQGCGLANEREMESFRCDMPVVMPDSNCVLLDPLIPNVHYKKMDFGRQLVNTNINSIIKDIREKCEELWYNKEQMEELRKNGRDYYEKNIRLDSLYKHFIGCVNKGKYEYTPI